MYTFACIRDPVHLLLCMFHPIHLSFLSLGSSCILSAAHAELCIFFPACDTLHLHPGTWQQVWQVAQVLAGGWER